MDPLIVSLRQCRLCARACGVDRIRGERGPCGAGMEVEVARWLSHKGEEPPLSGNAGSGTIFLSGCSLRCVFCQNYEVSQQRLGNVVPLEDLAGILLALQNRGCHNVNLVSPTHYAPQLALAIDRARDLGLSVPVVYNSHGFDGPEALEWMKGRVDIYLPDMKYASPGSAWKYSEVKGYVQANRRALEAMFRQVGHLVEDSDTGLGVRGLLVRILVLPGLVREVKVSLEHLKRQFGTDLAISLMAQYAPVYKAAEHPPLDRTLREAEYEETVDFAWDLGFRRLWVQEPEAAGVGVPDFSMENPFVFE